MGSITSKYSTGCGCTTSCNCSTTAAAPAPTCESHETVCVASMCLKSCCDVVTTAVEPGFFLTFTNTCENLPINVDEIFFYHPVAGNIEVRSVDVDGTYTVILSDATKEGTLISTDDCLFVNVITDQAGIHPDAKCLVGLFTAPAVSANETIYIENGFNLPIGATLTFIGGGSLGSYIVVAFVSAVDNVYAWTVQNAGSGHVPGTIIDGGVAGTCPIPIEVIVNVDICALDTTSVADAITVCENSAPRALISSGANDIITGDGSGGWELSKANNLDCCIVITECLKFSGIPYTGDVVDIETTNVACFETAYFDELLAQNQDGTGQTQLAMNIDGYPVTVTAYDSGTKTITIEPADPTSTDVLSWDAGQQICLGDCCNSCLQGGSEHTSHRVSNGSSPDNQYNSVLAINTTATIEYEVGVKHHYLIGYDNTSPLTVTVLEIDATYDDDPEGGPGKPSLEDPLVWRNKICNDRGCDQMVEVEWNFELNFSDIPADVRIHWQLKDFVTQSATLSDDTTPNPFNSISSQAAASGYLDGPSSTDAQTIIGNTTLGFGTIGSPKVFPNIAAFYKDVFYLEKANCAKMILWYYVQTEVLPAAGAIAAGTLDSRLGIRQRLRYFNAHESKTIQNNPTAEGFKII